MNLRMRVAIVEAEANFDPIFDSSLWIDPRTKKRLTLIAKNIDQIAYGGKSQTEKTILFKQTIVLFAQTIQRLYFFNGHYANLKPIQTLYGELVEMLPSSEAIQLSIEFDLL
jgi:hypothetical protein